MALVLLLAVSFGQLDEAATSRNAPQRAIHFKVVTPRGEPIAGAKIFVRPSVTPAASGLPATTPPSPLSRNAAPDATSNADGLATVTVAGETRLFDAYVDADTLGRDILNGLIVDQRHRAVLSTAPTLGLAITNVPEPLASRFIVREPIPSRSAFTEIQHGPFDLNADEDSTIYIPSPLSRRLELGRNDNDNKSTAPLSRSLELSRLAPGRAIRIDYASNATQFTSDPSLYPKRRLIVRFRTADGTEVTPHFTSHSNQVAYIPTICGRLGQGPVSPHVSNATRFIRSGHSWVAAIEYDEQVFLRTCGGTDLAGNPAILGYEQMLTGPGVEHAYVEVTSVPTVEYSWREPSISESTDEGLREKHKRRLEKDLFFVSQYSTSAENVDVAISDDGRILARVPKLSPALLVYERGDVTYARLLNGQGGIIDFSETDSSETTFSVTNWESGHVNVRLGVCVADQGLRVPIEIRPPIVDRPTVAATQAPASQPRLDTESQRLSTPMSLCTCQSNQRRRFTPQRQFLSTWVRTTRSPSNEVDRSRCFRSLGQESDSLSGRISRERLLGSTPAEHFTGGTRKPVLIPFWIDVPYG